MWLKSEMSDNMNIISTLPLRGTERLPLSKEENTNKTNGTRNKGESGKDEGDNTIDDEMTVNKGWRCRQK